MPLFFKGMDKIAQNCQVKKDSYLEYGDFEGLAFSKLHLGME
jgi:hypothetical protein